jgi:EXPERA (EXPanded EBP superfamily)
VDSATGRSYNEYNIVAMSYDMYGDIDRRYHTADPIIMAIEGPAFALDGILCVYWLYAVFAKKWYLHPVQILVSAFHLFGTVAFFVHELWQGSPNTVPAFDIPYGMGFVFSNSLWIVIPALYIWESFKALKPMIEKAAAAGAGKKRK